MSSRLPRIEKTLKSNCTQSKLKTRQGIFSVHPLFQNRLAVVVVVVVVAVAAVAVVAVIIVVVAGSS